VLEPHAVEVAGIHALHEGAQLVGDQMPVDVGRDQMIAVLEHTQAQQACRHAREIGQQRARVGRLAFALAHDARRHCAKSDRRGFADGHLLENELAHACKSGLSYSGKNALLAILTPTNPIYWAPGLFQKEIGLYAQFLL
jgi:hypothetical protein